MFFDIAGLITLILSIILVIIMLDSYRKNYFFRGDVRKFIQDTITRLAIMDIEMKTLKEKIQELKSLEKLVNSFR